jgi:hypothetical protein
LEFQLASKSDNGSNITRVDKYLPDVHQSEFNKSLFEGTVNRHFTKDNTTHVVGYIGEANPNAAVSRRLSEIDPHVDAFQLEPVMLTTIGTENQTLTQRSFLEKLSLLGVDPDRLKSWGSTTQFNWVPPINMDMLVNYYNYYWRTGDDDSLPQYITIESTCNKAQSRVDSMNAIIAQVGDRLAVLEVDVIENTFTIATQVADVFGEDFKFKTEDTSNGNFFNIAWTVASSEEIGANTVVTVVEPIAITSTVAPTGIIRVGRWWYNPSTEVLSRWNGASWEATSTFISMNATLTYQLELYTEAAGCACSQQGGWDTTAWDDNQTSSTLWNEALLAQISYLTVGDWITANGAPTLGDRWYNLTLDRLETWNGTEWVVTITGFSAQLEVTTGLNAWDLTVGCVAQIDTPWADQNRWLHKSQISSPVGIRRAALPIIEYSSAVELNNWVEHKYAWKYRGAVDGTFESVDAKPTRIELEPITGFTTQQDSAGWFFYLYNSTAQQNSNVDYTDTFVPGFTFKITDISNQVFTCTVEYSVYRELVAGDPVNSNNGTFATVVRIQELDYFGPTESAGDPDYVRIEPLTTSQGDNWRGYNIHWVLDLDSSTVVPAQPQDESHRVDDTPIVEALAYGDRYVYSTYEETTLSQPESQFDLHSSFVYDPLDKTKSYVLADSGQLQVYVDGVRQYGTYTELTDTVEYDYVVIGNIPYTATDDQSPTLTYVTGVQFNFTIGPFSVVKFAVGPAARSDYANLVVPVRTIEDESEFTNALINRQQPAVITLVQYEVREQVKSQLNQYPLFNTYHVVTGEVTGASPILKYAESETADINLSVQRRIDTSDNGREYVFEQTLLEFDEMRGYRMVDPTPFYWYNPRTEELKYWNGTAYVSKIEAVDPMDITYLHVPYVSEDEPTALLNVMAALWYQPSTNTVFQRSAILSTWVTRTDIVPRVETSDPTLKTVWRKGTNNEQYVPEYVDRSRTPVAVGSDDAGWETLDQWYFNSEHDNYQYVKYTQLFTHFNSILNAQEPVPGLLGGGAYSYSQAAINYGLGGLIKEHNDSFDLLISAINNNTSSPIQVIEFARDQYEISLQRIQQLAINAISNTLASTSPSSSDEVNQLIADAVISTYEENDFVRRLFGDSLSYDPVTDTGIKNWISTTPILGFTNPVKPLFLTDGDVYEILHHDGHRSSAKLSAAQQDAIARKVASTLGPNNINLGVISTSLPPSAFASMSTYYSGSSVNYIGRTWYTTPSATRQLYQLQALSITAIPPVITSETPEGVKYYNLSSNQVFENVGGVWIATSDPVGTIDSLWVPVDLSAITASVTLAVEEKLYDVAVDVSPRDVIYDIVAEDQPAYETLMFERFLEYVAAANIKNPFVNSAYDAADPFTWNYTFSTISTPPTAETQTAIGYWGALYNYWFNTPTPHLEPWKLQGYTSKPDWWDEEYLNDDPGTYGDRRWKYTHATQTGMWANVLTGTIPPGRSLPTVDIIPTYSYVPVNIDDVDTAVTDGYGPDELLPPYFDVTTSLADVAVRSLYTNYSAEIVAPDSDYAFGVNGKVEWDWRTSIAFIHDELIASFTFQPMRFMHNSFGNDYIYVDGLNVDIKTSVVPSHRDIKFHGEADTTTSNISSRGLNQWYVNLNRFSGRDTGGAFTTLWTEWQPKLGYQTNGIIDTSTFLASNKFFDIIEQDYDIILANTGTAVDTWVDAFRVDVLSVPPAIIQYNNESQWKFSLVDLAPISRTVQAYGVKKYPFTFNVGSTVAEIYRFVISSASSVGGWIQVGSDVTNEFRIGDEITISDSLSNDGVYTVKSAVFNPSENRTRVTLVEPLTDTSTGVVTPARPELTWETGTQVLITGSRRLPQPLLTSVPYYIIKIDDYRFSLAETFTDATNGNAIDFLSTGDGVIYVGEVSSSFQVYGGSGVSKEFWTHYAIDRSVVRNIALPVNITGIQPLIEIIDGYEAYQRDNGVLYGVGDYSEYDPNTGRLVDWQNELERFIDWAYNLRRSAVRINDRFEIAVSSVVDDEFTFVDSVPVWALGTPVTLTTTGSLPSNILSVTEYFFVPTGTNTFKLSVYRTSDPTGIIDIGSVGSGTIFISLASNRAVFPAFEINPSRNQIVIETPVGVLANVIQQQEGDLRVRQALFDQYGRLLTADKIHVLRQDLESRILVLPELTNDVELQIASLEDPYNYLHIGGAHLFVDRYEHIVLFNNYTMSGAYVYDPFVGLNVRRFNLDYYETENYTLRPTIGGYYLVDNEFERNIEGSISDIQTYYSAYDQVTQNETTAYSKKLLDYTGTLPYLDALDVTPASQFAFYRGMIQSKGSTESVNAFINSRRFIDARIDEFWAWKVAEFGDKRPREYPQIRLLAEDATLDDIQLLFAASGSEIDSPQTLELVDEGFELIEPASQVRYYRQPEQDRTLFLATKAVKIASIYIGETAPTSSLQSTLTNTLWANPAVEELYEYDVDSGLWLVSTRTDIVVTSTTVKVFTDASYDAIRMGVRRPTVTGDLDIYDSEVLNEVSETFERWSSNVTVIRADLLLGEDTTIDVAVELFALNPSAEVNNVSRLIDVKSNNTVATVPMWDPARGVHSPIALSNIDTLAADPAKYSVTPVSTTTSESPWNSVEVGTVWVDSTLIDYVPYYDDTVFPQIRDRLRKWGKLTDWSTVAAYQWVESTVLPDQWDANAQTGVVLPNGVQTSGVAKSSTFFKKRDPINECSVVDITQSVLSVEYIGTINGATVTGLNPVTTYTATIYIDGVQYDLSVLGSNASTFSDLASYVELAIGVDAATVDVVVSGLTITSTQSGPITVDLVNDTLFSSVAGYDVTTVTLGAGGKLRVPSGGTSFAPDDVVIVTTEIEDDALVTGTQYQVLTVTDGVGYQDLTIGDIDTFEPVTVLTAYTDLTVVKGFTSIEWTKDATVHQRFYVAFEFDSTTVSSPTLTLDSSIFRVGTTVSAYVNGEVAVSSIDVDDTYIVTLAGVTVNRPDVIDIVYTVHETTPEEQAASSSIDDGTTNEWWQDLYEYSTEVKIVKGTPVTYYYFWVQDTTTTNSTRNELSVLAVAQQFETIPGPYMVPQIPLDDPSTSIVSKYGYGIENYGLVYDLPSLSEQFLYTTPVFYRAVVLRGLVNLIRDSNRYVIQFTYDNALRYQPATSNGPLDLKNKHEEWTLIRKTQLSTIDRRLWNAVIESIVGYKLNDPTIAVPSINRRIYDQQNGTDTQYGLGEGQAFVDGTLALNTIKKYLTDPTRDFYPIDIDAFLDLYPLNTPQNIIDGLTELYNTFGADKVNEIWFEVLMDALTTKSNLSEIMKTSWIALYGIRILDVGGLFDD